MATLVLTAVGTAVGGPAGGLIGSVVGGAIDRAVFAPKPREGPRLTDLRLQTSTYGSAIPRIYGRVRVAGTVIWATDLKESRTTSGGGKGAPKSVSYSYSASFAVALSSRAAGRVARIWADGKLLRGSAGDFKSATGFRFWSGDADQRVDPLIASAVGIASCPAHRDVAYAVFEEMALADYGNRIPSLTFEIVADEDAVTVGSVARDLLPARFDAASDVALVGYAASGASIADAIGPLVALGGLVRGGNAEAPLLGAPTGAGAVSVTPAAPVVVERAADAALPRPVTLHYYDPLRDFQTGAQSANVAGEAERGSAIDLPAALDAAQAQAAAERIVRARLSEGVQGALRSGLGALALRPGCAILVPGLAGRWTLAASEIDGSGVMLNLTRLATGEPLAPGQGAAPGLPVLERDLPIPPTRWLFADLPPSGGASAPSPVRIAAAGEAPGWRGAHVNIVGGSYDGAAVARIGVESVIGTAASALPVASAALLDETSSVEVELLHAEMALSGADDAALLAGRNIAMIGGEAIQFGNAVQLTPTRWRLSRLLRGRGASEAAIAGHVAGEMFVLVDPASLGAIDPAMLVGGGGVAVAGLGDPDPAALAPPAPLRADRPLSPVHGWSKLAADGSVTIGWTRRSRAGWAWSDGLDAPIGENRELYRIAQVGGAGSETVLAECESPETTIASALLAAAGGAMTLRIRQVGSLAASESLEISIAS